MTNLLTPLCCTSVIFSAESKWDEMKIKKYKKYVTLQNNTMYMYLHVSYFANS